MLDAEKYSILRMPQKIKRGLRKDSFVLAAGKTHIEHPFDWEWKSENLRNLFKKERLKIA